MDPKDFPDRGDVLLIFFGTPIYGSQNIYPFVVNLDKPNSRPSPDFGLAINSDFQVLTKRESILNVVHESLSRKSQSPCSDIVVEEIPPDSTPAFNELFDFHGTTLLGTLAPRHEAQLVDAVLTARGRSRAVAACLLHHCFDKRGMKDLLLPMLKDVGKEEWWTGDSIYPARQFAYEELIGMGESVPMSRGVSSKVKGCVSCDHVRFISANQLAVSDLSDCVPELLKDIKPVYPEAALKVGIEAEVYLNLNISSGGKVRDVSVRGVRAQRPPKGTESVLLQAAKKWRFAPLSERGIRGSSDGSRPLRRNDYTPNGS